MTCSSGNDKAGKKVKEKFKLLHISEAEPVILKRKRRKMIKGSKKKKDRSTH